MVEVLSEELEVRRRGRDDLHLLHVIRYSAIVFAAERISLAN